MWVMLLLFFGLFFVIVIPLEIKRLGDQLERIAKALEEDKEKKEGGDV